MKRGILVYAETEAWAAMRVEETLKHYPDATVAVFFVGGCSAKNVLGSKWIRERSQRSVHADLAACRVRFPGCAWHVDPGHSGGSQKLAVIACHYNWVGFNRPVLNLRRFARELKRDGIALYGVELYLEGTTPAMAEVEGWKTIEVDERAILWQKEALLNMAEKMVPDSYSAVAPLDADVWFANRNWVADTLTALKESPAVQPFSQAIWTNRSGLVNRELPCSAQAGLGWFPWRSHPGFAWAFNRSFLHEIGGLYDYAGHGAGDIALAMAVCNRQWRGKDWDRLMEHIGTANEGVYKEWVKRVRKVLGGNVAGYAKGDIWHEWHGSQKNRRYKFRPQELEGMDVMKHLERMPEGYLRWTDDAPGDLVERVRNYFPMRKEDEA